MDINGFAEEQQDVFWIVGNGQTERHATLMRPGAVYAGQSVDTLCGTPVKIPQPTPLGRQPLTSAITARCEECELRTEERNHSGIPWDF